MRLDSLHSRHPSGTGNVHMARELPCGYTRKYIFAISVPAFPGDFLVVALSSVTRLPEAHVRRIIIKTTAHVVTQVSFVHR